MSQETHTQEQQELKDKPAERPEISKKDSSKVISKISLVLSVIAVGLAGYVVVNSINDAGKVAVNSQGYDILGKQFEKLKTSQKEQGSILTDVSSQNDSQNSSIKAIQAQVNAMNEQIATPTKNLYKQLSIANIQSAIDYLILAKDVVIFNGDIQKANDLVDTAFDKIEASNVVNISASDRQNIKDSLAGYLSKNDVAKKLIALQQQVDRLEYLTPQSLTSQKHKQSKNSYMKFLDSIVEVQDIPKDQVLVSTNQSKQFIADGLYKSLISLQNAVYSNDKSSIQQAKANILEIIKKYFVQDQTVKDIEQTLGSIKPQQFNDLNASFERIINQLAKQQNQLLANNFDYNENNSIQKGSKG